MLFVGDGGTKIFQRSVPILNVPNTVLHIDGINLPKFSETYFGYKDKFSDNDHSIRNIHIINGYIINCINVIGCTVINAFGKGEEAISFESCTNLVNCLSSFTGGYNVGGYSNCNWLVNCQSRCYSTEYVQDYYNCNNLVNCDSYIKGSQYQSLGFYLSKTLSNCKSFIDGGLGLATSFSDCSELVNCRGTAKGSVEGFSFKNCAYLSNCGKLNDPSSSGLLGGTNTKVDNLTVV